jgi:hypothetical protein
MQFLEQHTRGLANRRCKLYGYKHLLLPGVESWWQSTLRARMQGLAALLDAYNLALSFVRLVNRPVKPRYVISLSMIFDPSPECIGIYVF